PGRLGAVAHRGQPGEPAFRPAGVAAAALAPAVRPRARRADLPDRAPAPPQPGTVAGKPAGAIASVEPLATKGRTAVERPPRLAGRSVAPRVLTAHRSPRPPRGAHPPGR